LAEKRLFENFPARIVIAVAISRSALDGFNGGARLISFSFRLSDSYESGSFARSVLFSCNIEEVEHEAIAIITAHHQSIV
jgi:hypothetical protein